MTDSQTTKAPAASASDLRWRRRRLKAVALAVAGALVTFALIEGPAGVDLHVPAFDGSTSARDLGSPAVFMTSAMAGVVAWGLLAVLEKWTSRPRRYWTIAVILGFVVSIGGPLSGTGVGQSNRWLLLLLHVVVAAVLIPLLHRTVRSNPTGRAHD